MKILWVCANFLHPTNKGGQIRTLEMLRRLHTRHEVHFAGYADPRQPEGPERAGEYSSRSYAIPHQPPPRGSAGFFWQLGMNLFSPLPLSVSRYVTPQMRRTVARLREQEKFDRIVCDFLFPAPNLERLEECVLFEHNVETTIWQRHAAISGDVLRRVYFGIQAKRMFACEREACRKARHVIAVSPVDAAKIREMFGAQRVSDVPTGVDIEYFTPSGETAPGPEIVFVGSMDWMPNVDGVQFFTRDVLPLIWNRLPQCRFAIVGRTPPADIRRLGEQDPRILVTGTVPDIRPYLWGAAVSVVPLRIGSGTRLKIYESMAAKTAVVSTTVGAEGLIYEEGVNIHIADEKERIADRCIELVQDYAKRRRMAEEAWALVSSRFSWEQVTRHFEEMLFL